MGNGLEKGRAWIAQINEKNPYYLVVAIFIVILIIFYLFPLQFQLKTLQSLNPRLESLSREVETTRSNIQRVHQYERELTRLQQQYEKLRKRIKSKADVPFLLENISRIAGQHGVKIEQIMPQTAIDEPVLEDDTGKYFSVPIVMEAQSGYHGFGKFLNALERKGVFLRLPSFSVVGQDANPRMAKVFLTMELVIYEQKDP